MNPSVPFRIAWFLVLTAAGASRAVAATAEPTTRPSSVSGKIIADGEVPLSEMVVFLEPADASAPVPAASAQPVKISQKGAKFDPPLTIISVGQTVEFVNDEDRLVEHNVFSNAPTKKFDLGMYPPGQSRSVTFDKPGAVLLYCSIHRYMDGVVFVAPTPYASRVTPDAAYRIDNIPPGKWVVKTWQRRRRFKEATAPATLEAGQAVSINLELHKK